VLTVTVLVPTLTFSDRRRLAAQRHKSHAASPNKKSPWAEGSKRRTRNNSYMQASLKNGREAKRSTESKKKISEYRVVVDAGSSGTRANIYAFTHKNDMKPRAIEGKKVKGGLNTLVAAVDGVLKPGQWDRKKIVDLSKAIFASISEELTKDNGGKKPTIPVSVQLLATEGMRTYNRDNRAGDDALMRLIRCLFKKCCEKHGYKFLGAEILHGDLEATGAWVDANCRYPNEDGSLIGIMEMGGASMQIMSNKEKVECWDCYGKNEGMRKIVKKMSFEEARNVADNKIADDVYKTIETKIVVENDIIISPTSSDVKTQIVEAIIRGRKKIENKSLGRADQHEIFKEGHEADLKKAVKKYLFTPKDIKRLRAVTARRDKVRTADDSASEELFGNRLKLTKVASIAKVRNLIRQHTANPDNVDSREIKAAIKKHPRRNYLLVGNFEHLSKALVDGGDFDPNVENIFAFVDRTDVPKIKSFKAEFDAGNRFCFYFVKCLYEVLKEDCPKCSTITQIECRECNGTNKVSGIDIANSKIGKASWARGMAISSAFDKNHDTELSRKEFTEVFNTMRKHGYVGRNTLSGL